MASWHGDLCESSHCGDLAHPGHDLCINCLTDQAREHEITADLARRLTEKNEADVIDQDNSLPVSGGAPLTQAPAGHPEPGAASHRADTGNHPSHERTA